MFENNDQKDTHINNEPQDTPGLQEGEAPMQQEEDNSAAPLVNDTIQKLEEEVNKLKDSLLRQIAETENVRKRAANEIKDSSNYAITSFARELIEVQENLQRALDSIAKDKLESSPEIKSIYDGVELTKNTLSSVFEKFGIIRIHPLDQQFDHNFHQAIVQVPTNDKPENTVVQVIQAGYTIKDRLLRPALVAVAKPQN
jgi:molecular chaperone GrpE